MGEEFVVVAAAGNLRDAGDGVVTFPHRWTNEGVTVRALFTGAHLLHLAAAGCVLNDLYREAERLGLTLAGARVTARGGFEPDTWRSTGVRYSVDIDSSAPAAQIAELLENVDRAAEIPKALRAGASVVRT